MKHTPTPWTFASKNVFPLRIQSDDDLPTHICEMITVNPALFADAALIVRAVNSHQALVDALDAIACYDSNTALTLMLAGEITAAMDEIRNMQTIARAALTNTMD